MKSSLYLFALFGILFTLAFSACKKDQKIIVEDQSSPEPEPELVLVDCNEIYQTTTGIGDFYEWNPTYFDNEDEVSPLPEADAASMGVDTTVLQAGYDQLQATDNVLSFLMIKEGKLVQEKYFNGSAAHHSNNIHSASKCIVSAMTGIAIEEGIIESKEQSVLDFFPDYSPSDPDIQNITIEHLLTMTSGLAWEEDYTEYQIENDPNWTESILDLDLENTPGSNFNYSTGMTHLLSAILSEASEMGNCEYTQTSLIGKLGISIEHWGRDPQEYYSGGYNFYITPREMAKFGVTMMDGGQWFGEQIIPSNWVDDCLANQVYIDPGYDYGYCWWINHETEYNMPMAWGWGGQYICLIPELDIIIISTSDTSQSFPELNIVEFIEDYVIPSLQ